MKHTGYYLNEVARKTKICYELSDDERKSLQNCLLTLYKDLQAACEKHNLCIMLCGGSALGAVRHQGFIPWDDDLDALISRSDYTKLIEVFDDELGEKYILATQDVNSDTMGPWMKIYKKNTLVLTGFEDPNCKISNIGIDIMPIDNVPDNFLARLIEGLYLDAIHIIANSIIMYKDELGFFKKAFRQTFKTRCYYIARCTIGFIFSFFKVKKLFKKYNEIPAQCKGKKYCTIVRGRNDYFGEMHPQEVFFPPQPAYFEGVKINIPNKADIYLTKLYGDYMQIPPPEKRERHFFTAFSLDTTKE